MKGQAFIKTVNHTERSIFDAGTKWEDPTFGNLYEDITDHWQERAKRLRMRRWRKIRELTS